MTGVSLTLGSAAQEEFPLPLPLLAGEQWNWQPAASSPTAFRSSAPEASPGPVSGRIFAALLSHHDETKDAVVHEIFTTWKLDVTFWTGHI